MLVRSNRDVATVRNMSDDLHLGRG
jgi:hypothetical protein